MSRIRIVERNVDPLPEFTDTIAQLRPPRPLPAPRDKKTGRRLKVYELVAIFEMNMVVKITGFKTDPLEIITLAIINSFVPPRNLIVTQGPVLGSFSRTYPGRMESIDRNQIKEAEVPGLIQVPIRFVASRHISVEGPDEESARSYLLRKYLDFYDFSPAEIIRAEFPPRLGLFGNRYNWSDPFTSLMFWPTEKTIIPKG